MGVWAAEAITPPWEWRKANRAARAQVPQEQRKDAGAAVPREEEPPQAQAAGCAIKGNIQGAGQGGDRVYHMPGSASYERTVIDLSKGERYFCSEAEAQGAGWRAAKN